MGVRPSCHVDESDVRVVQTFLSAYVNGILSAWTQTEEAANETKPPRIWAGDGLPECGHFDKLTSASSAQAMTTRS